MNKVSEITLIEWATLKLFAKNNLCFSVKANKNRTIKLLVTIELPGPEFLESAMNIIPKAIGQYVENTELDRYNL